MKINCLAIRDEIAAELKKNSGFGRLAIILCGQNPASKQYVKNKILKAEELGIATTLFQSTNQLEIEAKIKSWNRDFAISGIILQRPTPALIDEDKLQNLIDPQKDVDGLSIFSAHVSPVVLAVQKVMDYLKNKHQQTFNRIVVVGKGITGGKPIYEHLKQNANFQVKQIDSKTANPDLLLKEADLIISCVGKPLIVRHDNIKKGAVLIGVGQHQNPKTGLWQGDYDENDIKNTAGFYTPTPGGIGPLTVIFLLKNCAAHIEKSDNLY